MTLEERLKMQIGELVFANAALFVQVEQLQKELAEKNKPVDPQTVKE